MIRAAVNLPGHKELKSKPARMVSSRIFHKCSDVHHKIGTIVTLPPFRNGLHCATVQLEVKPARSGIHFAQENAKWLVTFTETLPRLR